MMATSKVKTMRAAAKATVAAALVLVFSLTAVQAASANQSAISGDGQVGVVKSWDTPRSNTFPSNYVAFQVTGLSSGGNLWVALRNGSGSTFARALTSSSWTTIMNDNGNPYQPAGTFYLNTEPTGACGGSGCGTVSWSGNLEWNIRYN
jgi:hypothetical protein